MPASHTGARVLDESESTGMEKAHAGSGAEWSGVSTRSGDLLTLFCKNAGVTGGAAGLKVVKCLIMNHFEVVCRISAQGCDLLD